MPVCSSSLVPLGSRKLLSRFRIGKPVLIFEFNRLTDGGALACMAVILL